jgi:hypothetical protein
MKTLTLVVSLTLTSIQGSIVQGQAVEDRKDKHDPNSEWTYPYGKNPKGYFVYDDTDM